MILQDFNNLTTEEINDLCHDMANSACDNVDMKTLLQMFYSDQYDYLSSLSKEDLLVYMEDYGHIDEEEEE